MKPECHMLYHVDFISTTVIVFFRDTHSEKLLENTKIAGQLNQRQLALLEHAIKNPHAIYTIQEHQKANGISYQTARQDLLKMAEKMLLRQRKIGKSVIFVSPSEIQQKLTD
jgi:Fic family protein